MIITAYQICSNSNCYGEEEPVAMVLDLDRAKIVFKRICNGEFKFITARAPYSIKIVEFDHIVAPAETFLVTD